MPSNKDKNDVSRRAFIATGGRAAAASVLAGSVPLAAQGAAPASRAGSETSSADDCVPANRVWQYKRWGNALIARIVDGDPDAAVRCSHAALDQFGNDPEYLYSLAVAHTQRGDPDAALDYVQRAVDAGLPFGRFQAGPRDLLAPLTATSAFEVLARRYGSPLVHGPLLGCVTDRQARFWVRTAHAVPVQVRVRRAGTTGPFLRSDLTTSDPNQDYTAVVQVEGLDPDTTYEYDLVVDGERMPATWTFRTFPPAGQPARFAIGFGGCAGYTPWHERIWRTIAGYRFPLFLLTGDNVYIDDPIRTAVQRYCYYRRQSRPEYRDFTAATSIAAIWDDHDFADNDSWGGPAIDEPAWKRPVWEVFRQNWNNPAYAGGDAQPGCWFDLAIADVDLFMLDDRYYRTDPRETPATMLGPVQKQWLFDRLRQSTATFKLIVTSVPWAYGVKPGSRDPWQGYLEERDELFAFLAQQRIDGVVLLSGDRHRADIWKIDRPDGYPLYDFENARLTNLHTHDVLPGALYGYNETCTFGRLRFDTTLRDPEVTYDIITLDDEIVHSFTLTRSQIAHPS